MIGTDLEKAMALLRRDELVAIPTETVYGLAGNALHDVAVAKIFAVKNRPSFDPLIIHTNAFSRLEDEGWVENIPEPARRLAAVFMPGPLTLLVPKAPCIPDLVTSGSALVAVRIPDHPLTHELLSRLDFPLAAPSANPFGYISPTTATHVEQQLGALIPYILDGGPCRVGLESTIVAFGDEGPVVLRKGGIAVEAIEAVTGPVAIRPHSSSNPLAPGMLKSHYAPRVPLVLGDLETLFSRHPGKRLGVLAFREPLGRIPLHFQVVLSPEGDLTEAARRLFAGLRQLDALDIDLIIAEEVPETGLGRAVNDRLRRAAAREDA